MQLKKLKSFDLTGKRVILRTAYDVPLVKKRGKLVVEDTSRIQATIPTIRYLLKQRCKIIIITWLGRPGGKVVEEMRLDPVADSLGKLLGKNICKLDQSSGRDVKAVVDVMECRDIVMLENIRFERGEESNDKKFAKELASYGDVIVFDAFAQSHRECPSVTGILSLLPSVAGLNMEKEVSTLYKLLTKPARPFVMVLGGAKVSDKLPTINNLINIADVILVGGAMANNFLKARGIKIGASLAETEPVNKKKRKRNLFEQASKLLELTDNVFVNVAEGLTTPLLTLPGDLVAGSKMSADARAEVIDFSKRKSIKWNWKFLDIGPKTAKQYAAIIKNAKTVFWNGPLGYTESTQFSEGSRTVAKAMARNRGMTIIGGGDTISMIQKFKLEKKYSFLSTGGGASLDFLAGKELPAINYLLNK